MRLSDSRAFPLYFVMTPADTATPFFVPQTKQEAIALSAAKAAAIPIVQPPLALSRGEVQVLQDLYAVGGDAPPIRKQAIDFGLGLDAAGAGSA